MFLERSFGKLSVAIIMCLVLAPACMKHAKGMDVEFVGPTDAGHNVVALPNGAWEAFEAVSGGGRVEIRSKLSSDHGRTWTASKKHFEFDGEGFSSCLALLDRRDEVQLFFMRLRTEGTGKQVAIDRFIDVWHMRSSENRQKWSLPKTMFQGYTGSVQMALRLRSGRLLLPLGVWVPGRAVAPPTGSHYSTTIYSDDDGLSWTQSPAQLTAPCHPNYNGNNYGACEPYLVERENDVWMLIRSQDGFLYESTSPDGVNWSPAVRSPFPSSNSPAGVIKLVDSSIVVVWNNCQTPPRVDGQGVYGGRDALHAAISKDNGRTWRGFREIYLDRMRNASPPDFGDRGTAYPFLLPTSDGRVGVISGQGAGRRALAIVDPAWLLETQRLDSFSSGIENWSVFSAFGPARRYWRERAQGARLVTDPDNSTAKVLELRCPDNRPPDGAVWNFPLAEQGRLKMRLRLVKNFGGARISLANRFFDPTDDTVGENDVQIEISPTGRIGQFQLEVDRWQDLDWSWDTKQGASKLTINQNQAIQFGDRFTKVQSGVSYVRFRSTATSPDQGGLLIESVSMQIQ